MVRVPIHCFNDTLSLVNQPYFKGKCFPLAQARAKNRSGSRDYDTHTLSLSLSLSHTHTNLHGTTAEHALNTETDRHNTHRRTPVLVQYRETYVAVAVYVRVTGRLAVCERDLGEGVRV